MTKVILMIMLLFISAPYMGKVFSKTDRKVSVTSLKSTSEFILDTLTVYNPVAEQCDPDPLITASNAKINLDKLSKGKVRWMALSRNMLKRWNGKLNYGDTVTIISGDKAIDGQWIIQDTMNKRFKNKGDLLFHRSQRTTGRWLNVKLVKTNTYDLIKKQKLSQISPNRYIHRPWLRFGESLLT